jgi:hypothetical protein
MSDYYVSEQEEISDRKAEKAWSTIWSVASTLSHDSREIFFRQQYELLEAIEVLNEKQLETLRQRINSKCADDII